MLNNDFNKILIQHYLKELDKLEKLEDLLKAYGIINDEFNPNLNLNRFKIEMKKWLNSLQILEE